MHFHKFATVTLGFMTAILPWESNARALIGPVFYFNDGMPSLGSPIDASMSSWAKQKAVLDITLRHVSNYPNEKYVIVGSTDNQECPVDQCGALSLRRARYVYDWLVEHGANSDQFCAIEGEGSSAPIDESDTVEARARNRRVEINLVLECPH